ncbi:MAG: hypothetical protein KF799_03545 [Bdellovibrionales bacterium]|nr:hypothetical protein [Bdellovibrionales bacterium]
MTNEIQLQIETLTGGWLINLELSPRGVKSWQAHVYGSPEESLPLLTELSTDQTEITTYVNPDLIFGETINFRVRLQENALKGVDRLRMKLHKWLQSQSCSEQLRVLPTVAEPSLAP